jgi:hypothetical protein
MLKKGIFILVLLLGIGTSCYSQEISHQVLVPMASVMELSTYSLSQTVGEAMVSTLSYGNYDLTQGFQQPSINMTSPLPPQGNGVEVYPNPVTDILKLELFGSEARDFNVTIFGLNGSVFYQDEINCTSNYWMIESINLSEFKNGMYFVMVRSRDERIVRLFKIEKM